MPRSHDSQPEPSAPAGVTRRPQADAERERRLLDAAEKLFLEHGFHVTTMDAIAKLAGVSKKTIYLSFDSKEALFAALVHARRAPLLEPVAIEGDLEALLLNTVIKTARFILSPKEIALSRVVAGEARISPKLARLFEQQGPRRGQYAIEQCIVALFAGGDYRIEDTGRAAHMLLGMALGMKHSKLLLGIVQHPTKAEIEQSAAEAVDIFLRGARKDGATAKKR